MSTITTPPFLPTLASGRVPYRLSVEKYEAMVASGVFTKRDRLELIEGLLVAKMTRGRKHSAGLVKCRQAIERLLPAGWHVRIETPVRIPTRDSEPEPDISVVRGDADDYLDLDPGPPDVTMIIEVSDSTLDADRAMVPTYGGGGIAVYWIVNVKDRQVEVHANPVGGAYPVPTTLAEGQSVDLIIGGQVVGQIPVADLLPRQF